MMHLKEDHFGDEEKKKGKKEEQTVNTYSKTSTHTHVTMYAQTNCQKMNLTNKSSEYLHKTG